MLKTSLFNHFNLCKLIILRLPPYNCDLSPIELVWNDVKYAVKISNIDQNINNVVERAKQVMENYDTEKWKKHVQHIQK